MSNFNQYYPTAYSAYQPALPVFPIPIVAKRAPTTADKSGPIGQIWVWPLNNQVWILTSIVANVANWSDISGGAGVFSSLTINPGPTNLSTIGNGTVTIGNATNTGLIDLEAGVGGININGNGNLITIANDAAANSLILGTLTAAGTTLIEGGTGTGVGTAAITVLSGTTGDIQIGSVAHTGALYLGVSTAGDTVNIASGVNTGAEVVNIAAAAAGAATTVNVLSGVATAGTQTLNLATGASAKSINIGTGAAVVNTIAIGGTGANVITLGNTQTAGSISIGAAMTTGTLNLGSTGAGVGILTIAGGTGAQTINIAASGTGAKAINIGATGSADVVSIGSTTAASTLTLKTPTGTPVVASNGLTATVGNITATNGNFVLSTAASFLQLPGPVNIMTGAGVPANGLAVNVGDMYINTTAASAVTRAYMASAANTWVNFTMSA